MLSRSTRTALKYSRSILRTPRKVSICALNQVRFQSTKIGTAPKETTTNLFDDSDPKRNHIFEYSWGTWLKNDKQEKQKRFTKFSIQGLNETLKNINSLGKSLGETNPDAIERVDKVKVLSNNIKNFFGNDGEVKDINQVLSLHEGKHHRIYRIQLEGLDKKLVLRLPYSLGSKVFTKRKIESEVATMDFLSNALNLNIPKVLAYSGEYDNQLGHPFMLMEYIEDVESSLMKKWNPLVDSKDDMLDCNEAISQLNEVIEPLADFNKIVGDFIFDNYGSIYFKDDCPKGLEAIAYEGQDRWVIGPSVESAYYRNKEYVAGEDIDRYVGPWKRSEPLKMIQDLVDLEILSLRNRLAAIEKGENVKDDIADLKDAIKIFEKLRLVAGEMFNLNPKETIIPNLAELLKPRLLIGDLDPMNVLVRKDNKGFEFLDFENCVVKPFLISNYPKFLEYNGEKIFSLQQEVNNFNQLDDVEKEQYRFMFKRTRNQFLWEVSINKNSKELVGVISPVIKLVKSCYLNILNFKNLKDALYIENGLIEISTMWENYNGNGVLGKAKGEPNPIKFNENEINEFAKKIQEYEISNGSKPFTATGGWVPQDMFNRLEEQGLLIKDNDKDEWKIDTDKVLK